MRRAIKILLALVMVFNLTVVTGLAKEDAYSVGKVKYTYADDGSYAYSITAKKTIRVSADVTKNTDEDIPFVMIAALYSEQNSMLGFETSESITLKKGETKTVTLDYTLPSGVNSQNNFIRVFCKNDIDGAVIYKLSDWQAQRLEAKPPMIREKTHINVDDEERQTFKGMGTSDNSNIFPINDEGHDVLANAIFSEEGLGFNVYRLWAELTPTAFEYDDLTKNVEILDGGRSFKMFYLDSGMVQRVEKLTNNEAIMIITPATSLPAEMREPSGTNIVMNTENVIQTTNAAVLSNGISDLNGNSKIIFGDFNVSNKYTTVWLDVATQNGGTVTISNADTDKKLATLDVKPTGGDDVFRTQGFSRSIAMNGVKRLKIEFSTNDGDFGSIREITLDGETIIKTSKIPDYAKMIANYVRVLEQDFGMNVDYVTMFNEPLFHFTPTQLRKTVIEMRKALDNQGLGNVKIIADEWAEIDEFTIYAWQELLKDKEALAAIDGLSFHSYQTNAPGYYEQVAEIFKNAGKEVWMTESSDTQVLSTLPKGDIMQGAEQAARLLNDLNNNVEYWVHFLGQRTTVVGGGQNSTALTGGSGYTEEKEYTKNGTYHYYKQARDAFDYGCVFRYCTSTEYGDMSRPRGKKPAVNAAFAKNPDGTYALGVVNSTLDRIIAQGWAKHNNNPFAKIEEVEISVKELENKPEVEFDVYRSGENGFSVYEGTITARYGKINLTLSDCEFVTLRSKQEEKL